MYTRIGLLELNMDLRRVKEERWTGNSNSGKGREKAHYDLKGATYLRLKRCGRLLGTVHSKL
jgi:hypothetical protein